MCRWDVLSINHLNARLPLSAKMWEISFSLSDGNLQSFDDHVEMAHMQKYYQIIDPIGFWETVVCLPKSACGPKFIVSLVEMSPIEYILIIDVSCFLK